MHYPFGPGLIKSPKPYDENGVSANYNLSEPDKDFMRMLYPKNKNTAKPVVPMSLNRISANAGEQEDFCIEPQQTRYYTLQTVGTSDSKIVLFEMVNGKLIYVSSDDDSGVDKNAMLRVKLFRGRKYQLSVRVHYIEHPDGMGIVVI